MAHRDQPAADDKLTGALHSPPHEGDGITLSVRTYSISIERNWQVFYEAIWQPEIFPKWASGLTESDLRRGGTGWLADGPDGPITIRFTPHNDYGVMDHVVGTGDGQGSIFRCV